MNYLDKITRFREDFFKADPFSNYTNAEIEAMKIENVLLKREAAQKNCIKEPVNNVVDLFNKFAEIQIDNGFITPEGVETFKQLYATR